MKFVRSKQFKKCLKKYQNNHAILLELKQVLHIMASGKALPVKYKDHALKGKFAGLRELHLKPDHLLVYKPDKRTVTLLALGGHAKLF